MSRATSIFCSHSSAVQFPAILAFSMELDVQVPMGFVNLKRMANIAKHYRSRFTTIVGIQPTGWTHSSSKPFTYLP